MMILSVISLIISFLIQGLFSNLSGFSIPNLSIFSAVYVLINLVVIQQYFEDDKKFLILIVIFGMLTDIVYSNTLILCTCLFIAIFYLNKLFSFFFPYNIFTINGFSILSMIIFHTLTFIFLMLLGFDSFRFTTLLKVIGCNIIMTIIYTTVLYYCIDILYKKFKLKHIKAK